MPDWGQFIFNSSLLDGCSGIFERRTPFYGFDGREWNAIDAQTGKAVFLGDSMEVVYPIDSESHAHFL